jgi:RNA polymerase sigma-70 factor (ECF subfamily)
MSIERVYGEESGRILATLIRVLGDFDLAEEVVQEAFAAALAQWPAGGTPANPHAWLVGTVRHKPVDLLRRLGRWAEAAAYRRALSLVATEPERRYLERRLAAAEAQYHVP